MYINVTKKEMKHRLFIVEKSNGNDVTNYFPTLTEHITTIRN